MGWCEVVILGKRGCDREGVSFLRAWLARRWATQLGFGKVWGKVGVLTGLDRGRLVPACQPVRRDEEVSSTFLFAMAGVSWRES